MSVRRVTKLSASEHEKTIDRCLAASGCAGVSLVDRYALHCFNFGHCFLQRRNGGHPAARDAGCKAAGQWEEISTTAKNEQGNRVGVVSVRHRESHIAGLWTREDIFRFSWRQLRPNGALAVECGSNFRDIPALSNTQTNVTRFLIAFHTTTPAPATRQGTVLLFCSFLLFRTSE